MPMKKIILLCLVFSACLRVREGEDMALTNDTEVAQFKARLRYVYDENTDLCYAVLNNYTDGFRNTFTFAAIPCDKVFEE